MTCTFKLDLDTVRMNRHAKYLGQMSFHSEVIVGTQRDTRTLHRLRGTVIKVKVKASHTRHRALGPELIPVYRQSACR